MDPMQIAWTAYSIAVIVRVLTEFISCKLYSSALKSRNKHSAYNDDYSKVGKMRISAFNLLEGFSENLLYGLIISGVVMVLLQTTIFFSSFAK